MRNYESRGNGYMIPGDDCVQHYTKQNPFQLLNNLVLLLNLENIVVCGQTTKIKEVIKNSVQESKIIYWTYDMPKL